MYKHVNWIYFISYVDPEDDQNTIPLNVEFIGQQHIDTFRKLEYS